MIKLVPEVLTCKGLQNKNLIQKAPHFVGLHLPQGAWVLRDTLALRPENGAL